MRERVLGVEVEVSSPSAGRAVEDQEEDDVEEPEEAEVSETSAERRDAKQAR